MYLCPGLHARIYDNLNIYFIRSVYARVHTHTPGCFSGLEDQTCKLANNGTADDMIYWHRMCTKISDICAENMMLSYNNTFCRDNVTDELRPVNGIIHRVLASEEYY